MPEIQNLAERLSEDEALRGELSDVGFAPLLDWAIKAVELYSTQSKEAATLETYTDRLRKVVQAAVASAEDSKLDPVEDLLDFETAYPKDKLTSELKALTLTSDAPDNNAVAIATVLQKALVALPEKPHALGQPRHFTTKKLQAVRCRTSLRKETSHE